LREDEEKYPSIVGFELGILAIVKSQHVNYFASIMN